MVHDENQLKEEKQTHETNENWLFGEFIELISQDITTDIQQWQISADIDANETVKYSHIAENENRDHVEENLMSLLQRKTLIYQHKAPHNIAAEVWNDTNLTQHAWGCPPKKIWTINMKNCILWDECGWTQKTFGTCSAISRNLPKSGTSGHGQTQTKGHCENS